MKEPIRHSRPQGIWRLGLTLLFLASFALAENNAGTNNGGPPPEEKPPVVAPVPEQPVPPPGEVTVPEQPVTRGDGSTPTEPTVLDSPPVTVGDHTLKVGNRLYQILPAPTNPSQHTSWNSLSPSEKELYQVHRISVLSKVAWIAGFLMPHQTAQQLVEAVDHALLEHARVVALGNEIVIDGFGGGKLGLMGGKTGFYHGPGIGFTIATGKVREIPKAEQAKTVLGRVWQWLTNRYLVIEGYGGNEVGQRSSGQLIAGAGVKASVGIGHRGERTAPLQVGRAQAFYLPGGAFLVIGANALRVGFGAGVNTIPFAKTAKVVAGAALVGTGAAVKVVQAVTKPKDQKGTKVGEHVDVIAGGAMVGVDALTGGLFSFSHNEGHRAPWFRFVYDPSLPYFPIRIQTAIHPIKWMKNLGKYVAHKLTSPFQRKPPPPGGGESGAPPGGQTGRPATGVASACAKGYVGLGAFRYLGLGPP